MSNAVNQNILFRRPSLRSCETSPGSPGPLKPTLPLLIFLHQKQVTQFSQSPICHTCRCYLSSTPPHLHPHTSTPAPTIRACTHLPQRASRQVVLVGSGEGGGIAASADNRRTSPYVFFLLQKSTARSGVPLIGRVALYIRNVLPCRRGSAPLLTPPLARACTRPCARPACICTFCACTPRGPLARSGAFRCVHLASVAIILGPR